MAFRWVVQFRNTAQTSVSVGDEIDKMNLINHIDGAMREGGGGWVQFLDSDDDLVAVNMADVVAWTIVSL